MEVIDIVKLKLPIEDTTPDVFLELYLEEVGQSIMTYCNRDDIPVELRYVYANMVVDYVNSVTRTSDTEPAVSSIKEGDVTVQFGSAKVSAGERSTEKLLFDYSKQLNSFRKLRW